MKSKNLYLSEGSIFYRNVDLKISSDQLFDLRIQLGLTTLDCLEMRYNEIVQLIREEKLEFLTD